MSCGALAASSLGTAFVLVFLGEGEGDTDAFRFNDFGLCAIAEDTALVAERVAGMRVEREE